MIYRLIYKLWKYFWVTLFSVTAVVLSLLIIAVGVLQLPQSRDYIKQEVTETFDEQFKGSLTIDQISGFLPFRSTVEGGNVYAPSDSLQPVFSFDEAEVSIDWWQLLRQNISITTFEVRTPNIHFNMHDRQLTLFDAFTQHEQEEELSILDGGTPRLIDRINIYAPALVIQNGTLTVDSSVELPEQFNLQPPFVVEQFDFNAFIEILDSQIFVDINRLYAELDDNHYEYLLASGQFYSDGIFLELNRFEFETAIGELDFSFEASPVDLFAQNISGQLKEADYRFTLTESTLSTPFIQQFIAEYPDFDERMELELLAEGNMQEFFIDRFQANIGETSFIITASAENLLTDDLTYKARLGNVIIHPSKLDQISDLYLDGINLQRYSSSTITGEVLGTRGGTYSELNIETGAGAITLDGSFLYETPTRYDFHLAVDSLDITPFVNDTTQESILQGIVNLDGKGFGSEAEISSSLDVQNSKIYGRDINSLTADLNFASNILQYSLRAGSSESELVASGRYSTENEFRNFTTNGELRNFDIKPIYKDFHADQTRFNSTFSANLEWTAINDLFGRVNFDMDRSVVGSDTLRPHQFYADLNPSDNERRVLRLTSSFFDGEIEGTIVPEKLQKLAQYWTGYVRERISEEFLFDDEFAITVPDNLFSEDDNPSADLSIEMSVKDLSLFRQYVPDFPEINSQARFTTNINATKDRLLVTGNLFDEEFTSEIFSASNFNTSFTANFRHGVPLKMFSTVDLQINSDQARYNNTDLQESYLNISMRNDSLYVNQLFERLDDDLKLTSTFSGSLGPGLLDIAVENFNLGTADYMWRAEGEPTLQYREDKSLTVNNVSLYYNDELIEINGTFSTNFEDSVNTNIRNVSLERISDLIDGRIRFSGIANGEFVTRTLTQIPYFQGNITVDNGRILDRVIGDVTINSQFNPEDNQFDTSLRVFTDPENYPNYYIRNDGIGQDIRLDGYIRIPEDEEDEEDLFYFDADLREVDMWIVTFIAPTIVAEVEGRASGTGYLKGSLTDYDFDSTFEFLDVHATPFFTNVDYTIDGTLGFNRTDGLLFHEVNLKDTDGGTGTLTGQVDLEDFAPLTTMNLNLELNNLEFMNNPFDPDVPFYGQIFGTGTAQITGTNFSPFLRTTSPIRISSKSRISIPLEPETEFEQDRRFIQFVDSFDLAELQRRLQDRDRTDEDEEEPEELTFIERFTMDLNFAANDPVNVRLIFDRVTNDILSANGTGQIRLLLQDQDVSMFGRFNIQGGNYQFVSGDIFTRRFSLQEGGSISWQGDLIDANLDITAVYRARPDISALQAASGGGAQQQQQQPGQRVPVELVLQIGGTITAIENEFFFRLPSGIEGSSDPTIATQINNLNQNEDEKLIQATSILLSGNFIPSSQAQGLSFTEGISGTAAVVNPLITSQVINPLLSNQINSLLRSDITFDIDVNLNAFNEVDLGVALRLFDDRVILRREGQITGEQSEIGDLGATYRINRTFSLTAFHRQDPTLANTGAAETRQTQEMNGLGLEAQMQFNTWQSFRNRLSNAVRSLFGIQRKEDEADSDEESLVSN